MTKRSKLKDIAEALGISITTVSRAINNKTDINDRTKRRVLAMANELDYKPNNLAISLRKNKISNVVGVVIPMVNHYFFSTVLKGIMAKAHLHNYLVIVGESLHKDLKERVILEEFLDFGVSGIIMAPCMESNFHKNLLPIIHRRIPTVITDRIYDDYEGNYVLTDDYKGAFLAVEHLSEQGYKRIAHIGSTDQGSVGLQRLKGFKDAVTKLKLDFSKDLVIKAELQDSESGIEAGYSAAKKLLSKKNRPDAIFAVTDDVALGVYRYAREAGVKIPDELGVVGFSNSLISKYISPSLTTVEQNGVAMGEMAFDFFIQALHSNGHVFSKVFEPKLLERESSRRKSK